MRDIIDERDEKERIRKSIIKFWNVNYIPTPYSGTNHTEEETAANEVCVKQQEEEFVRDASYNATTGSYSGEYGAKEVRDEVTRGRIDRILQEKDEALRNLIAENSEDHSWEKE